MMSHKPFLEFKKITHTVKLNAQDLIKDRSKFLNEKFSVRRALRTGRQKKANFALETSS